MSAPTSFVMPAAHAVCRHKRHNYLIFANPPGCEPPILSFITPRSNRAHSSALRRKLVCPREVLSCRDSRLFWPHWSASPVLPMAVAEAVRVATITIRPLPTAKVVHAARHVVAQAAATAAAVSAVTVSRAAHMRNPPRALRLIPARLTRRRRQPVSSNARISPRRLTPLNSSRGSISRSLRRRRTTLRLCPRPLSAIEDFRIEGISRLPRLQLRSNLNPMWLL
jgi:hypothetical protein